MATAVFKNQTGDVKNIKPSASGPSEECVRVQSKCSEQPSSSLPGLPVPEVEPYEGETEPDSDVPVETPDKSAAKNIESSSKKGSISIMSHTLKKKSTSRKYKSKILDSVHELQLITRLITTYFTVLHVERPSIIHYPCQDTSMSTNIRNIHAQSVTIPLLLKVK